MRTERWQVAAIVFVILAFGSLAGCNGGDDGGGGGGQPRIEDVLPEFTTAGGVEATLMSGQPPAAAGGPTIMAPVAATVPDATTQALTVTSDEEFDSLTLSVPGTDGYWVLNFGDLGPGAGAGTDGTSVTVLVTFAAEPPLRNFDCLFNGSNNGGAAGPNETTTITIDTCTIEEFCHEECSAPEAATCAPFCDLLDVIPSCALEINAPAACAAITSCTSTESCDEVGQCAEEATDGLVDADCATETCEASLP